MKPHEETWEIDERPPARTGDVRITTNGAPIHFTTIERARLVAAAPEMARRLLAHGQFVTTSEGREWHTDDCMEFGHGAGCETDRAVLTKAGCL